MRLRFCSVYEYIAAILKIAKRSPCSGAHEPSQGGRSQGLNCCSGRFCCCWHVNVSFNPCNGNICCNSHGNWAAPPLLPLLSLSSSSTNRKRSNNNNGVASFVAFNHLQIAHYFIGLCQLIAHRIYFDIFLMLFILLQKGKWEGFYGRKLHVRKLF